MRGKCVRCLKAEHSGLRHRSSRRLGLISGLSVFLRYFYSSDTKRQSQAELIAKATDPSLAVHISSGVSIEIFGCPATRKYLPCIRKWLFQLCGSCHHLGSSQYWQRFPSEVAVYQNGVNINIRTGTVLMFISLATEHPLGIRLIWATYGTKLPYLYKLLDWRYMLNHELFNFGILWIF